MHNTLAAAAGSGGGGGLFAIYRDGAEITWATINWPAVSSDRFRRFKLPPHSLALLHITTLALELEGSPRGPHGEHPAVAAERSRGGKAPAHFGVQLR